MDLSTPTAALVSKSYDKLADICHVCKQNHHCLRHSMQVAAQGIAYRDVVHLLAHIYVNNINSARFLWKSIPSSIKESQPEVTAACKFGQKLWIRDCAGVYEAIPGFD